MIYFNHALLDVPLPPSRLIKKKITGLVCSDLSFPSKGDKGHIMGQVRVKLKWRVVTTVQRLELEHDGWHGSQVDSIVWLIKVMS